METFIIQQSMQLQGELPVRGAKNHALKVLPAALLSSSPTTIHNIPEIEDVHRIKEILEEIGCGISQNERTAVVDPIAQFSGQLPAELVQKIRASVVLVGPLLARFGEVHLPYPGGDNFGKPRPINFFIDGCKAFGATVEEVHGGYHFSAPSGLQGTEYIFPRVSVTGTETLMMAATLAHGETILRNAAMEPEVVALGEYLKDCGANIEGLGTPTITVVGTGREPLGGAETTIIPDRIETGSFIALAAATQSNIHITGCQPQHMYVPLHVFQEIGVQMHIHENSIEVLPSTDLRPIQLATHEYPGFATDIQSPTTVLLTQATGDSLIHETIYEGRLVFTDMLNRMGANIDLMDPHRAIVHGKTQLRGAVVASPDIRAGIGMLIAGLVAEGETTIQNIYHIDRGYERIEERLQHIGANITRV